MNCKFRVFCLYNKFISRLAPGIYSVIVLETQDELAHLHVVGRNDRPHVNVQAYADIFILSRLRLVCIA